MNDRLLNLKSVLRETDLSRSSILDFVKAGTFPAPVKVGPRAVRWRYSEIQEWIAGLTKADQLEG